MATKGWSQTEVEKLISLYGKYELPFIYSQLSKRTIPAIKNKIGHLQLSGAILEHNPWTLQECLFLLDTYRKYSVDEYAQMLPHPRWAIQKKIENITSSSNSFSDSQWSSLEDHFLIEKAANLSVKDMAIFCNRHEAEIEQRLKDIGLEAHNHGIYSAPSLINVDCDRCGDTIRISAAPKRTPAIVYCSFKCKYSSSLSKRDFLYMHFDERLSYKEIAKLTEQQESRIQRLANLYLQNPDQQAQKSQTQQPGTRTSRTGKREDLGDIYFRSSWEANLARVLNLKKKKWEYEPKTFVFKNLTKGSVAYLPDFYVKNMEGRNKDVWIEVKGKMNPGDYTKMLNFKRQYPDDFAKMRGVVAKNSKADAAFKRLGIPIIFYYGDLRTEFKSKLRRWEGR